MTIQEIYCDESGYTGNNLFDMQTPYFTYAAIAVNHEEAKEFVARVIQDYKLQGNELKFSNLRKHSKGRQIITNTLKTFDGRIKVVINHKKYNLACKFFEYIFEPTISEKNYLFYNIKFNNFIANLLYEEFESKTQYAEEIFEDFYNLMTKQNDNDLFYMFSSIKLTDISLLIEKIQQFCIYNRTSIKKELESLEGSSTGKWILDLSFSSLNSVLAEWGTQYDQLKVFCDDSVPLQEQSEILDAFIGIKDKTYINLAGQEHPINYNLVDSIKMVDSLSYPGIQIADIASGVFAFVFKENQQKGKSAKYPKEWTEYIMSNASKYSIMPDSNYLHSEGINFKRNILLLEELLHRSAKGIPLLQNIENTIDLINYKAMINIR
ncbi:MAG: DUF3800 domain-containing protein [Sphaerospermopsis sp. SIO1G2]|nr:DUF3800 domain-containing protein [Sphaerospermopsis sp. SIO1G2]